MGKSYVCSTAKMTCPFGDMKSTLTVLPIRTIYLTGQPQANISDHKSMVNIAPFGRCKSLAFPATQAATAAAMGTLTPMPCIPNTPSPWMGGKIDTLLQGQPALLKSSKLMCIWGGIISLDSDGQTTGNINPPATVPYVNQQKISSLSTSDIAKNVDLSNNNCRAELGLNDEEMESFRRNVMNDRRDMAREFYKDAGIPEMYIDSHLSGIDFNKPVKVEEIPPPDTVYQYTRVKDGVPLLGNYATPDSKAKPTDLGIYDMFNLTNGEPERPKQKVAITDIKPQKVLKSTAAPYDDIHSVIGQKYPTKGGGTQYFMPYNKCNR